MNIRLLCCMLLASVVGLKPLVAHADTSRGIFVSPTTGVSVGTIYGVFVGVSQYQHRSLNLTYADRDAHSLYLFFSEHFVGRIPPDHFRLLTNEQATRGRVLQALSETLRLAQPEDLVIISLAMHGLADVAGNDLYFLAHDTDPNYPEDRAISQYDLIKQIQRSKARKIVMMLDACHAGGFGATAALMRGASSAEINRMLITLGQVQDGIAVLTSSSAAELSQEGDQFCGGHGAFTCSLVEGLKGHADVDNNGLVQIRELFDFTYREVKKLTKGSQHPAIEGRYDNGLPLSTVATPEDIKHLGGSKKDFKFTDYEALKAKAEYQSKLEKAWQAVEGIAKMEDLQAESRLAALDHFVQDFPEDNPHRAEAAKLVERTQREMKQKQLEQQRQLELSQAKAAYQAKLEQAWQATQSGDPQNRLTALNRFLQEYPDDNPHRAEASGLVEQTQREMKQKQFEQQKQIELQRQLEQQKHLEQQKKADIARAPAYDAGKQAETTLEREITGADGAPMVLIPSGDFMMGSSAASNERPPHRVYLDAYYIDVYEVTNSRYSKFLEASKEQTLPYLWKTMSLTQDGDRPVIGVSWADADAYCSWAEKRLPTEAEWEKAARGADGRNYPWGNNEPTDALANFGRCCGWSYGMLDTVGSHKTGKSPYGVYDLAGNVWEWVADWYDAQYYKTSPEKNPPGPSTGHDKVMRGGSWSNRAGELRATTRDKVSPTYRNFSVGFRCVASIKK